MLEKLQQRADSSYADIIDLTNESDAFFDATTSLAQAQVESESTNNYNSAYGFGAVALGVAAAAYFYNKKEQAKVVVSSESDFLLV